MSSPTVYFHWRLDVTQTGLGCQVVEIELLRPDRLMFPENLTHLHLPPQLDPRRGVILTGRAPIWLYGWLVHACHHTRWVACYDPRLGAIVVNTHHPEVTLGQVLLLQSQGEQSPLAATVMVVGPPRSGKSLLSHALFQGLLPAYPGVYLQRAHWDGEGNWFLEIPNAPQGQALKQQYRGGETAEFFPFQAQAILNLRRQKQLVIVDVGGKVDPAKQPLLEACTHYLVVSCELKVIPSWHEFCAERGNLQLLGIVHTHVGQGEQLRQQTPCLEIELGIPPNAPLTPPPILLEMMQNLARPAVLEGGDSI
ncbi:CRISPR-associated Csx3 family protein [Gloeomargarita lithophora Alchichica-D10]|uniref:CRISPR-associated Csx3 family protein n=1 Tax=Gloeomargarita lithophora Alchichica-D10 TaxID=1188229 RepID=A0A1J0AAI2_9CYAN|nr:CRISPR-associated ring nuclease Crn3/Csx3 [Gloeomargarita lithophora]APB32952.1 CRISPR-associated Csx3 family protein [Gloeomargarita lithophora Alchichica-D10]